MSTINKVPASAGAEWLLGGFALLRRAPVALGTLAILWGLGSTVLMALAGATGLTVLLYAAQFLLILAGPLFFGAMIWAAREVDQGRPAQPAHLLQPIRDGHGLALLITLLPQLLASFALGLLLLAMIGPDQLKHLGEVWVQMQTVAAEGGQPDPSLVKDLPAGRLLLWLLLVAITFVGIKWMTFIAAPQILFTRADAITAMRNSLRACVHNWTAMLVFYLLAGIAIFAITFGSMLLLVILQLVAGPIIAALLWQLVLLAVLTPVLAGAMYTAWRQMMTTAGSAAPSTAPATTHIEV
ncbi:MULTISPECIES: BPSS1780 family membrane protein [unclassified Pseudoxanthomonas]|uniref:BPSS1780 family membrane protein n=1 Tax=unclassified Pseudoxanthomonas TaxID=2645906 RepID=UPI001615180C|nr:MULTISPECIES: BPSS1780 family membrane protein [unclassified Pseudoxanthomonas]MBB3276412.1 hypothetical protein [Pseudoxanthomonas sp. OG2]MBV7472512.1 hypothetical protein [Pseudoxanthomonas sp. PXM05]